MRTGWSDITTAEWIALQGTGEAGVYRLITGQELTSLNPGDITEVALIAELFAGFGNLEPEAISLNVETETVGQFETVRSFLRRFNRQDEATARAKVLPYVYGMYKAIKPFGVFSDKRGLALAEAAKQMPCDVVVPFALAVLEQIEAVSEKYYKMGDTQPETVGEDDMDAFGFYPVLHLLAGGDITRHEQLMQLPVRTVYTHLFFLNQQAKSQKDKANG